MLDLTRVLAGPYATMILADLGADVIKVEQPGRGDIARGNGPFIDGYSSYFLSLNRGKKSVTLDLSQEDGRNIFLELVEKADILVENFIPGNMDRLGIGYEVVSRLNPRIIYAACSGFGQYGPYAGKPAFDVVVQAMGGIMSITGEPGGPPIRPGASIGDIGAGLYLCIGILTALHERQTSGRGQMVDISMLDCQAAILENAFARYFATGEVPGPLGTRHPVFAPFQVFRTREGYLAVAIAGDQWPLFCAAIGRLDIMDDPRFADGYLRSRNYAALEPILNEAFQERTAAEWQAEFEAVGISCGPVNNIAQVANDDQIKARDMIVTVSDKEGEGLKLVNTPVRLSRTPGGVETPSPALGEHTDAVLHDLLGMTVEQVEKLRRQGIV